MKFKLLLCLFAITITSIKAGVTACSNDYIITTKENKIYVWKIKNLEELKSYKLSQLKEDSFDVCLDSHVPSATVSLNEEVIQVSITPDGKYFTAISKSEAKTWSINGSLLANLIMK